MFVPVPADTRENSRACSLYYIARRLGHGEKAEAFVVRQVENLIAHEGFPPPLPYYRAGRKIARLGRWSRWNRDAADAWFDGTVPPPLRAALADNLVARHAAELARRAEALAA